MLSFSHLSFARKALISSGLVALIVLGVAIAVSRNTSTTFTSPDRSIAARDIVAQFGNKLQTVSILGSTTDVALAMDAQYALYVTPELLAAWKSNPKDAPGKTTSSPWPDRIEVSSVARISDTEYQVSGHVIEMTSQEVANGGVAGMYGFTASVENRNGTLYISEFTAGAREAISKETTVRGTSTCLPHKDTSGPVTLECAFGIKADNGLYYALDLQSVQSGTPNFATNTTITVEGTLVPIEAISSNAWQKYDIKGIIRVSKISTN